MAFATYTQSFGTSYANGQVVITDSTTGVPATIMAATTGGVVNTQGLATLDGNGDLSVVIDTAQTWTVTASDGNTLNAVEPLTYAELAKVKAATSTGSWSTAVAINAQTGTTYTLSLTDTGATVTMSNASANTLTVPANASVAFAVGAKVKVTQLGAGATTVAAAGGVTINKSANLAALVPPGQYDSIMLTKTATNTWFAEAAAMTTAELASARGLILGQKPVNAQTGTSYTLVLTDAGKEVTMTNGSANALTIPLNATVAYPLQTQIDVYMTGAGTTTVGITGGGTIVKPSALALAIAGQYSGIRLTKVATDTWRATPI